MRFFQRKGRDVSAVTDAGLCTGCGVCAGICPTDAISMTETPGGLLEPVIDADTCTACGICLAVCSGAGLIAPPDAQTMRDLSGPIRAAYLAYATDETVQRNGQSGGVVSALLIHGIETGGIPAAAVTRMPQDGSLRPVTEIVDTPDGIRLAQLSKYCPVPAAQVIRAVREHSAPVALVGLACHLHGVSNAAEILPGLHDRVCMTFGLFCAGTMSYGAVNWLLRKSGLNDGEAVDFAFRDNTRRGWPGDVSIRAKDGRVLHLDRLWRQACRAAFTPARCRLCFDKLNVLADLSFGDPWAIRHDPAGAAVILVRSKRGAALVQSAIEAHALIAETIDPEDVLAGQRMADKRTEFAGCSAAAQQKGLHLPDFGLPSEVYGLPPASDTKEYHDMLAAGRLADDPAACDRAVAREYRGIRRLILRIKAGTAVKKAIRSIFPKRRT